MQAPKISYLVSTYDSASYLNRQLNNLLREQTQEDIEVIVYNAASPGADLSIAQRWSRGDDRVKIIDSDTRTPYGVAWLECWRMAKAPYVCNSNTDDLHHLQFTERFVKYWAQNESQIGFMYAGWKVMDEDGIYQHAGLKPTFDLDRFQQQCESGPQVSWRNDESFLSYLDWGLMYERANQHTSAFDYWLFLYFLSLGFYGYSIQEILTFYTQRPDSIENRRPRQNTYESLASISEFFPHQFKGKLACHIEFADFKNLPDKEGWINVK